MPPASRGHFVLPQDSADVVQWTAQHAAEHGFSLDAAQCTALASFQRLYEDLIALERLDESLLRLLARKRVVKGLYLWGGVGRGKSFLMDSFFNCAPAVRKRRSHYHRFMQEIHARLQAVQGQPEPMALVAKDVAKETRLLCLDEFHVSDITDAMLLRRLLEGLFDHGVVLVTTSNYAPDDLYPNGLQRTQFLPAIALMKANLEIINVDAGTDYRLLTLEKAGTYHVDAGGADAAVTNAADAAMEDAFLAVARHETDPLDTLDIEGRPVPVRRHARGVAWFDFDALCDGPRGKPDYIELARHYHTILISGVPLFSPRDRDRVRRFIWLVDEFYDRRVKLILAAAALPEDLYAEGDGKAEFARTASRLTEMQTRRYLGEPHLA
ncbi:MAG: cell division protein ZapE [Burkholderiales bacterium]